MENWESLIAKRLEAHKDFCCQTIEDPVKRNAREYNRKYEATHKEQIKENHDRWRKSEKGKESERRRGKKYRQSHHEKMRAKAKRWYENNKAKSHERSEAWKKAHPEKMKVFRAKYRREHQSEINAKKVEWYYKRRSTALLTILININPIGEPNEPEN